MLSNEQGGVAGDEEGRPRTLMLVDAEAMGSNVDEGEKVAYQRMKSQLQKDDGKERRERGAHEGRKTMMLSC